MGHTPQQKLKLIPPIVDIQPLSIVYKGQLLGLCIVILAAVLLRKRFGVYMYLILYHETNIYVEFKRFDSEQ